jgi:hypothetical protein
MKMHLIDIGTDLAMRATAQPRARHGVDNSVPGTELHRTDLSNAGGIAAAPAA